MKRHISLLSLATLIGVSAFSLQGNADTINIHREKRHAAPSCTKPSVDFKDPIMTAKFLQEAQLNGTIDFCFIDIHEWSDGIKRAVKLLIQDKVELKALRKINIGLVKGAHLSMGSNETEKKHLIDERREWVATAIAALGDVSPRLVRHL